MDMQLAFDTSVAHLLRQNARSLNPQGDSCMYRGADGRKCAVGPLIPDDRYFGMLEGSTVDADAVRSALADEFLPADVYGKDARMLADLQGIHDCEHNIEAWPRSFGRIAQRYGLGTFVLRNCLRFWTPPAP